MATDEAEFALKSLQHFGRTVISPLKRAGARPAEHPSPERAVAGIANSLYLSLPEFRRRLESAREKLFAYREKRVRPQSRRPRF
jgi:uncharacterized protein YyaL (SSP411 family)